MCSIQEVSETGRVVELKDTEETIGRGPFLGVTDKRVSRHHGTLKRVVGGVEIKSIHINPCFYARKSAPEKWLKLDKNETVTLEPGDVFSLIPKAYIYKIIGNDVSEEKGDKNRKKQTENANSDKNTATDHLKKTENSQKSTEIEKNSLKNGKDTEKQIDLESANKHASNDIQKTEPSQQSTGKVQETTTPSKIHPNKHSTPPVFNTSTTSNTFMDDGKEVALPVDKKRKLPAWMENCRKKSNTDSKTPIKSSKKKPKRAPKTPKSSTAKKKQQKFQPMHFDSDSEESDSGVSKIPSLSGKNKGNTKKSSNISDSDSASEITRTTKRQRKKPGPPKESDNDVTPKKSKTPEQNTTASEKNEDNDVTSEVIEMVDASVLAQTTNDDDREEESEKNVDKLSSQKSDNDAGASNAQSPSSSSRSACAYGSSCYRKNPMHRQEFSHPGDPDYVDPAGSDGDDDSSRPECPYGTGCYRKNPLHKKQYNHTKRVAPKRVAKLRAQRRRDDESSSDDYDYDDSFLNDNDSDEDVDEGASDLDDEDWNPSQGSGSQKKTRKSPRSRNRKRKSYRESGSDLSSEEDIDDLVADAKEFSRNKKMWKK